MLLGIPGSWLLVRRGQVRYVLVALVMILSFAMAFAFGRSSYWFGGLSWPPRFLIPVVPYGILVSFPILQRATRRPRQIGWLILVAGCFAYGVWIQLSAISLNWTEYGNALPPEAQGFGEWTGGLNLVEYLRWVVIPGLWSHTPLDIVWTRLNIPGFIAFFALLATMATFVLCRLLRSAARVQRWWLVLLILGFLFATGLGLRTIYIDPEFQGDNQALQQILPVIEFETKPGDVLLLSDLSYERFFSNYAGFDYPRVVSLPFQPGEQPSPEQAPQVVSDNPDNLVHPTTGPMIFALAQQRPRLWLLSSSGPFIPWTVRPVERFMMAHFYPIREVSTDPHVRLIEFSTVPAPDLFAFRAPAYSSDLVYGVSMHLLGYDLPAGTTYQPGDVLPISLYWMADAQLDEDYTVAWFLRTAEGAPVTQGWDLEPGGGFTPTSSWLVNAPIWDHRAIRLPADLEEGEYRLWVVVYSIGLDGTVHNLPVSGQETLDNTIGVLPTVISITSD